jgi:hypothetical protein
LRDLRIKVHQVSEKGEENCLKTGVLSWRPRIIIKEKLQWNQVMLIFLCVNELKKKIVDEIRNVREIREIYEMIICSMGSISGIFC